MQNLRLQCVLLSPLCSLEVGKFAFRTVAQLLCTSVDLNIPFIWNVMKGNLNILDGRQNWPFISLSKLIIASFHREGQVSGFVEYSRPHIDIGH